jgi:hypothetical protein
MQTPYREKNDSRKHRIFHRQTEGLRKWSVTIIIPVFWRVPVQYTF